MHTDLNLLFLFDVNPCGFLGWRTYQCPVHSTTLWATYNYDVRP